MGKKEKAGVRASLPWYPRPLTNDSRRAPFVSSQGHKASMALNPALSEVSAYLLKRFSRSFMSLACSSSFSSRLSIRRREVGSLSLNHRTMSA